MAEDLTIINGNKEDKYRALLPQIEALIKGESNRVANLANVASALKYGMNFFWVGFYVLDKDELVLGPFQGPPACTRIKKGKGVCGSSWEKGEAIIVPDVNQFAGHIACSSLSKSEIVLPLYENNNFYGVLDVDSDEYNSFDKTDLQYLEKICELIFI